MSSTTTRSTSARYWIWLAVGWLALGLVVDVGTVWATGAATLVFGAATAAATPRFFPLRARARAASHGPTVAQVYGLLVALAGVTAMLALVARADGMQHPVTAASLVVAVVLVGVGPRLVDAYGR